MTALPFSKGSSRPQGEATGPAGDALWDWLELELLTEEARQILKLPKPAPLAPAADAPRAGALPPPSPAAGPVK